MAYFHTEEHRHQDDHLHKGVCSAQEVVYGL